MALSALALSRTRYQEQAMKKKPPMTSMNTATNREYCSALYLRNESSDVAITGFRASEICGLINKHVHFSSVC